MLATLKTSEFLDLRRDGEFQFCEDLNSLLTLSENVEIEVGLEYELSCLCLVDEVFDERFVEGLEIEVCPSSEGGGLR